MNNLINNLRKYDLNNYNKLFKFRYLLQAYRGEEWKDYLNFNKIGYGKQLVHRDNQFEIFVLSWKPGQKSGIHNHSEFGCLMKVLDGELQENIYSNQLDLLDMRNYNKNDVTYIDNSIGYHSIINPYYENSVSLHIYSPCYHKTDFFNDI